MYNMKTVQEIPSVIESIENHLKKYNIPTTDIRSCCLLMEEMILAYQEKQGCADFSLELSHKRGKVIVALSFACGSYDIFSDTDNILVRNVKQGLLGNCIWQYKNNTNYASCEFETTRSLLDNLLYLGKFLKQEKARLIAACSVQLLNIIICIVIPVLSSSLISSYALSDLVSVVIIALILTVVRGINCFLVYVANRLHNAAYNKIRHSMEMDLADALMNMSADRIDKHGTGMIIERMTSDTASLASCVESLVDKVSDYCNYIGNLIAILILCPWAFAVKVVSIGILIAIQSKNSETQQKNEREYLLHGDQLSDVVGEMARGSKDIKLLHSEKPFMQELERVINKTNESHLHLWNTVQNYTLLSNEANKVLELCFYLVVAIFMSIGYVAPTEAIVLFNYSNNLTGMDAFVGDFMSFLKSMSINSERVHQLTNTREFAREVFGKKHLDSVKGDIEFRNVSFAYSSDDPAQKRNRVLRGLNLKINAGEIVAFVGKSGCGKTTALNLIPKLFVPLSGSVFIDGVDINELDKDTIRGNVAVVSQNPYVFNKSIRDNLRLIQPNLTEEQMVEVCRAACIHDDILNLSNGYDTIIGEGGNLLSGGQRQRLALARCILKNTRIVLLDEATSALDNSTQASVQKTVAGFAGNKTVVIIAHRLSTIKKCDRIFYFQDGHILAEGRHEELLKNCPEYRTLYMDE